ncbi:hypothetical protein V5O48_012948 [Marasmius crinis-equi]|uniref:Dihydroxyacetone kinase n=1 Tax=Marasmius crinis-equi TaxID=585013 RepID=A0ABR3F1F8_9AGAR
MSTKHVYNSSEGLVAKSLEGATYLNPSLRFHAPSKSIYTHPQSRNPNTSVSVISGGGAGHEPAHAGYTGRGMLTASISGDIFASPSAKSIGSTIRFASSTSRKSVLVIINNYTGDRLNFGLAIEKARAEGIEVDSVVVADDVSLLRSETEGSSVVGPRGLAGNILVCKILGAAAERGMSLKDVKSLGDAVVGNLKSVGVGLDHCHVPGRARSGHEKGGVGLGDDELEVGLGLHNEPGVERKPVGTPESLLEEMIGKVLSSLGEEEGEHGFISEGEESVLFVNNLGGMSQLEMGAVVKDVVDLLAKRSIHPARTLSSSYMTSLNAPGLSISLLNVTKIRHATTTNVDPIALIDDPTDAVAWIGSSRNRDANEDVEEEAVSTEATATTSSSSSSLDWKTLDISPTRIKTAITRACEAVLRVENDLTRFDTIVGDGDCGETFARGARAILSADLDVSQISVAELVRKIGDELEDNMGGTIGALFAIFFTAWSSALSSTTTASASNPLASTLHTALEALHHHTPAKPGDRTIIDALEPFCLCSEGLEEAASRAREGAERTRGMKARLGRAVYVGAQGESKEELPPDPGAWGVAAIVEGFYEGYRS